MRSIYPISRFTAIAFVVSCGFDGPEIQYERSVRATSTCDEPALRLWIEPAESQIDAGDARVSTIQFGALVAFVDGDTDAVAPRWSVDPPELGSIDTVGTFTPSGDAGGTVTIRAVAHALEAVARVDVLLV